MIIYGVGDHIADMLVWHPELAGRIERVFDKDQSKIGKKLSQTDKYIESPERLRDLPSGTKIAIAAIRYLDEITRDILNINPELVCLNIDDAYYMDESELSVPVIQSVPYEEAEEDDEVLTVVQESDSPESGLFKSDEQALRQWQVQLLEQVVHRRHVLWGTKRNRVVLTFAERLAHKLNQVAGKNFGIE